MPIVQVNVSLQVAPVPSTLQSTGALVTGGGSTLTPGTYSFLTQPGDLTAILGGLLAISNIVATQITVGSPTVLVTVTTTAPHGLTGVNTLRITGVTPNGYNGRYSCTVTGASTFTYNLSANPGPATVFGYYLVPGTSAAADELVQMVNTFFAQGNNQGVYVLELGTGSVTTQVGALVTFIAAQPQFFYAYLVPREWDGNSAFLALVPQYNSPTSKTYFFITTVTGNYAKYSGWKAAVCWIEAPSLPTSEFSAAGMFFDALATAPSATNKVAPFAFRFLYGVTAYPTLGNATLLAALANAKVNVVGTGAEGGIGFTMAVNGTTMDGSDFLYWYSADWIQIAINLDVTNAVINGSNNPLNPLYYNQNGINGLQIVGESDLENAVTFGLATGLTLATGLDGPAFTSAYAAGTYADTNVINAIPFINYTAENPGDYPQGRYAGFGVIYRPATGFKSILFYVTVSAFISP